MVLNVHPLLVHFPIAFLTGYSLLEFARFPLLTRQTFYFYTKALLLFFGVVTAGPTILAGLLIEDQFPNHSLVDLHKIINITATVIFFIVALEYLVLWIDQNPPKSFRKAGWWSWKVTIARFVVGTPFVILPTLIGFGLIMVGGALGGIIVYGPNLDPFTHFIASILGIK